MVPQLWRETKEHKLQQGWSVFLSLGASLGGLALVLGLSGSAKLGQISGVASLVALTLTGVAMWNGASAPARPSALVLFAALLSLAVQGRFYVETHPLAVLAPMVALSLPALTSRPRIAQLPRPAVAAAAIVAVFVPVVIGVVTAWLDQPPPDPYGATYSSNAPARASTEIEHKG